MTMRLRDKVCIITGAAGGQGEVAVEIFAKEGAKILATDAQIIATVGKTLLLLQLLLILTLVLLLLL